ncbi:MAG: SMR family transporter [Lentisphaeraceae bacterium]|nr:SMR family transporter [Lentisphaeraceae bacterium]
MKDYIWLAVAIVFEVGATTMLVKTKEFTKVIPSIAVIIGYILSFYCMSFSLRTIPVGISYAIWSGIGITAISLIAYFSYGQKLDLPAILGMSLILSGVLIIKIYSKSTT